MATPKGPIPPAPVFYDILIDEFRYVTQEDVDQMRLFISQAGPALHYCRTAVHAYDNARAKSEPVKLGAE